MSGQYRPPGHRRPRKADTSPVKPKGFEDVPELSDAEVERRVDVRGGGAPPSAPVERPVRRAPAPRRRERAIARDALLLVVLVIVGIAALSFLLPDGPLTARATNPPGTEVAIASATPTAIGAGATINPTATSIVIVDPSLDVSQAPTAAPPTSTLAPGATPRPTTKPAPTATPKPGQTPHPTPVVTPGPTAANTATVIVKMHIVNNSGGSALASNWTMKITGEVGGGVSPNNFAGSEAGTPVTVTAGKGYLVTDNVAVGGYGSPSATSDCLRSPGVGLAPGTTVTCTITRNDKPRVAVVTNVTNDDGGTAGASDAAMTVTGGNASPSSFAGSAAGRVVVVDPGVSYSVGGSLSGYTLESSSGACSTSLAINDPQGTCTITFNDIPTPTGPVAPLAILPFVLPRRWRLIHLT